MLLLAAPKIPQDAARAVNRVAGLNVRVVTSDTLTELLGLPGMRVVRFALEEREGQPYLHLFCEHSHEVAVCPRCGQAMAGRYDHQDRSVRHLDIWGRRTIVHFPQRRFECVVCGEPFTELLTWIDPKRRQTRAFEQYVYECLIQKKMTRKQVALREGLHEETVLSIFKQQAQETIRRSERSRVRVLGIDEIYLGQREYALVLSDIERRRVITVLPDRLKTTLEAWLDMLSPEERHAIQVVSMDMWEPYRQAVQKRLPQASIIADRFHVMQQLNHQLDLLRRHLRQTGDESLAELLKDSRWILLKNRRDLTAAEEAKLRLILEASDEVRTVYLLKEAFRTICDKITNREQAARFLRAWIWEAKAGGNRYLNRFAKTLQNWWQEFLNYFVGGVTQGFVEGINRAIRALSIGLLASTNSRTSACRSWRNAVAPDAYPSNLS